MRQLLKRLANQMLRPFNAEIRKLEQIHSTEAFSIQSRLVKTESPTIFDVGAHVGDVSASYRALFPTSTIHAFEPFPDSFRKLRQRFQGDSSVKVNEVAVSNREGTMSLHANRSSATNSILTTDPRGSQFWRRGRLETKSVIEVPTMTVDTYCKSNAIGAIDILKLDIQGAELRALQGSQSMLADRRVGLIYMELILAPTYVDQPFFEDYLGFLRQAGYMMLDMFNAVHDGLRLIQSDVIFVRTSEFLK